MATKVWPLFHWIQKLPSSLFSKGNEEHFWENRLRLWNVWDCDENMSLIKMLTRSESPTFDCNVWRADGVRTADNLSVQIFFYYLHQIQQDSRVIGRYLLGSVETRLPNVKIIIDEESWRFSIFVIINTVLALFQPNVIWHA